jgi:formyltetrahydrofolate deformylase
VLAFSFTSTVVESFGAPLKTNNKYLPYTSLKMSEGNQQEEPQQEEPQRRGTLRVFGPDQKGIVAAFSQLLYGHGCGIVSSEQSTDTATNMFFQRIHFDYTTMHTDQITLETGIREVCARLNMQNLLDWGKERKRVAIMVSKYDHCLWELLLRHKAGELDCDISVIVSNHPDLKHVADTFGIP